MAQHCQQRHESQLSFCSSTLSVGTGICLAPFMAARWLALSPQWEELPTKLSYQEGKPFPKLPPDLSMCLMGQNWVTRSGSKQSTKDEIFLTAEDCDWSLSPPYPKHASMQSTWTCREEQILQQTVNRGQWRAAGGNKVWERATVMAQCLGKAVPSLSNNIHTLRILIEKNYK